jgi:ABC-type transport system substrate-binding protein
VAVPYLPSNFNPSTPAGANSVTQMVMEQVWPQAFVIDPQFDAETTGFIDSAEVVSLNPMTVSYAIDPKATWSDGYPITATDFEYNWQQQLLVDPMLPSVGLFAGYRDIKSISGSDDGKTVTVVFKSPYSDWEGLFGNLIPAHIAERAGWASAFSRFNPSDLVSGGPFIVSSLEPGKQLVLTRNAKYWGAPAHLQSIVFLVERSDRAMLAGLQSGSVSIAEFAPGPWVDGNIARIHALGTALSMTTTASPVLWQLVFNLNDPVVSDPVIRAALVLVTDRGQLVADSVDLDHPDTVSTDSRIFAQGQPGLVGGFASPLGYDPVEAATLFKSLGYLPDQYGILRAGGTGSRLSLTVTGPQDSGVIDNLELQLQAQWAACGVTLTIHNVPMKDLLRSVLPQGRYQLALAPYLMPDFPTRDALVYTDPVVPLSASLPSSLSVPGLDLSGSVEPSGLTTGTNWLWSDPTQVGTEPGAVAIGAVTRDVTGLDDPAVAVEFEDIMSELNTDTQDLLLSKLDGLLTQDLPTYPLFQAPVSLVQQADIVNVSESPTWAGPLWDAQDWVLKLTYPAVPTS